MSALEVATGERAVGLHLDLARDRMRERDQGGHQLAVDQLRALRRRSAGNVEEPVPLDGALSGDRPEAEQVREQAQPPRPRVELELLADLAVAVAEGGIRELERDPRRGARPVVAGALAVDLADQLRPHQARQVVVDDHPLVEPGDRAPRLVEDRRLRHRGRPAEVVDHAVVQTKHRQVKLRDKDVNVVARIADHRDALTIARNVGLLAGIVQAEQQLGRVVAPVEERVADRTVAVDAFEVRPWRAEVLGALTDRSVCQRAAVGRDVMSDQLAEHGPAGRDPDGIRAGITPVADAAGTRQPKQPLLLSFDGRKSREEPLVPVRCAIERSVGGA